MTKLPGPGPLSSPSPRKRKDRQQQPYTPSKSTSSPMVQHGSPLASRRAAAGMPISPRATKSTGFISSAAQLPASSASLQTWQRCCSLLREAVVDPGCPAAAMVPLRPSLRRIKDDLVRVLDEAVSSHNGNASLLVLGPPGTGKTLVVERALQEICNKYNGPPTNVPPTTATTAEAPTTSAAAATAAPATATVATASISAAVRNVGVVRLNGLLQPDERTAFQEVARQLCRDFGQKFVKSATFDENLVFLKGMLHALYKCLKKVVFVVDEFQQYAKRGKQQMLYYLLDLLQDSKIQAAVIGLSSAHNVAEDLEKRVMSRVGRRRVIVTFPAPPPGADEAPGGFAGPALGPPSPGASSRGSPEGGAAAGGSAMVVDSGSGGGGADSYEGLLYDMLALHPGMTGLLVAGAGAAGGGGGGCLSAADVEAHNRGVAGALREPRVASLLSRLSLIGAPPQHLALVAEVALAAWGQQLQAAAEQQQQRGQGGGKGQGGAPPMLGAGQLEEALREVVEGPEMALFEAVKGLPVLSLVLLVAAHRLQRKGQPLCNFEMVWDEYRSIQGGRGAIAFDKKAAAAAWQGLPLSGLAHYADANVETRGRDLSYAGVVLLVGSRELEEGIRKHPHCPDAVLKFHLQEI
ncbi:hypothetical protein Agub_g3451 [Astrephomene gubernaculifera]|uniref:Origin recognition complex subunit 4 n=1 Tax=Astrephomene gubernaculifera TaxID=47775 RepID=A0AAD3HIG7_9CHLO|nr:hypothetical protein Agub_g3451 [Astrephomene gubernaculifera]